MLAVSCSSIVKTYHGQGVDTKALRGVDLQVVSGETLMLVGPSGCGKTTLISIIAAILDYDQGDCFVFGENLSKLSERQRTDFRGKNIGFVFQAFNLIPTLNCVENVAIPLLISGAKRQYSFLRSEELLSLVGLEDKFGAYPAELSGGQQQRVAIARSLVHNPRLIVCDEPTSSLDRDTGQAVMQLFKSVAQSGERTLIIVTHDNRIYHFGDRIAQMNDGRIEKITLSA